MFIAISLFLCHFFLYSASDCGFEPWIILKSSALLNLLPLLHDEGLFIDWLVVYASLCERALCCKTYFC